MLPQKTMWFFFLLLTSKIKLYEHLQPGKSECLKEQFHLIGWEGNKMPHFEVFCVFLQSLVFVVGRQLARNNVLRERSPFFDCSCVFRLV